MQGMDRERNGGQHQHGPQPNSMGNLQKIEPETAGHGVDPSGYYQRNLKSGNNYIAPEVFEKSAGPRGPVLISDDEYAIRNGSVRRNKFINPDGTMLEFESDIQRPQMALKQSRKLIIDSSSRDLTMYKSAKKCRLSLFNSPLKGVWGIRLIYFIVPILRTGTAIYPGFTTPQFCTDVFVSCPELESMDGVGINGPGNSGLCVIPLTVKMERPAEDPTDVGEVVEGEVAQYAIYEMAQDYEAAKWFVPVKDEISALTFELTVKGGSTVKGYVPYPLPDESESVGTFIHNNFTAIFEVYSR